jgi:hypothetical protein
MSTTNPPAPTTAAAKRPPHINDPRWQVAAQVPPTKADYPIWTDAIGYALDRGIASGHHFELNAIEPNREWPWSPETRWISVATAARPMAFKEHKPTWPCWLFSDASPGGANAWIHFDWKESAIFRPDAIDSVTGAHGIHSSYTHWLPGDETQKPEAKPVWRALKEGEIRQAGDQLVSRGAAYDIFSEELTKGCGCKWTLYGPGAISGSHVGRVFRRIATAAPAKPVVNNVWRQMDKSEQVIKGDVFVLDSDLRASAVDLTNADRPHPQIAVSGNWLNSDSLQSWTCTYFRRIATEAPAPAPVSTVQVPAAIKVGDRVILTSTRHGDYTSNPVWGGTQGCVAGTVTHDHRTSIIVQLPIVVKWDNGTENSYRTSELEVHASVAEAAPVVNRILSRGSQRPLPTSLGSYQEVKYGKIREDDILCFGFSHYEWADGLIGDPVTAPGVVTVLRMPDPVQTAPGVFKLPETTTKSEETPIIVDAQSQHETIKSLQAQVRTLQSKNARQASAVRDLEEKNRKLREASAEKTLRIDSLKAELRSADAMGESQQQTIQTQYTAMEELRSIISMRGSQLNDKSRVIEDLKQQLDVAMNVPRCFSKSPYSKEVIVTEGTGIAAVRTVYVPKTWMIGARQELADFKAQVLTAAGSHHVSDPVVAVGLLRAARDSWQDSYKRLKAAIPKAQQEILSRFI